MRMILAVLLTHVHARSEVVAAYKPRRRHPELFDEALGGWKRWIDPALLEAVGEYRSTRNTTAIHALLRREIGVDDDSSGVYSFALLNAEFCKKFLEELDNFYQSGLPIDRPNSMVRAPCSSDARPPRLRTYSSGLESRLRRITMELSSTISA